MWQTTDNRSAIIMKATEADPTPTQIAYCLLMWQTTDNRSAVLMKATEADPTPSLRLWSHALMTFCARVNR